MLLVQLLLLSKLLFLVVMTTLKAATVVRVNNSIEEQLPNEVLAIADLCPQNLEKVEIKHLGMSQFLSLSSLLATSQLKIFVPPKSRKPQHSVESILHLSMHYQKLKKHYIDIIENHEHHVSEAERHGNMEHLKSPIEQQIDEEELSRPTKRAKPDDSQYPWVISDFIHLVTLSPSLTATLDLLKLYAVDPKGTKRSLINSPTCPEFPDSEWTNILAGHAVNLNVVLIGYYSTSNNDERIESIVDLDIKFGTVAPTKIVSSAGEWTIAWNRACWATSMAFPHRAGELADYAEYIIALFAATNILFHDWVILFNKAVHHRVSSRHDLELTHFDKFADLRSAHMDSIGAAVVQCSPISKVSSTSCKKQEACN